MSDSKYLSDEELRKVLGDDKMNEINEIGELSNQYEEKNFNDIRDEKFCLLIGDGVRTSLNNTQVSDMIIESMDNHSDISNLDQVTSGIIQIDGKDVLWKLKRDIYKDILEALLKSDKEPALTLTLIDNVKK